MELPANGSEVTAAWLTQTLRDCNAINTASVTSLTVGVVDHKKGITGHLVRLQIDYDQEEADAPHSLIAKFSSPLPDVRAQFHLMGFYEREVRFYEQLAAFTPVRTPRCYFSNFNAESGFSILLLEDLAPARNGDSVKGCTLAEVTGVLEALASIHTRWWMNRKLEAIPWLQLKSMAAPEAMAAVFTEAWPSFLSKLSFPRTAAILRMGHWIAHSLDLAASVLFVKEPRTLIHNDIQGDNLFFDDNGQLSALVDWQLTTYARGAVDVAGLIRGQLDRTLRHQYERDLVQRYHHALVEGGVGDYPFEQCWEDYRLATVLEPARLASAVGLHRGLQLHPGAFWDVRFPRYIP